MKTAILFVLPLFVFASGQKLSHEEHESLHGFNQRPSEKLKRRSHLHKLHKITEDEAKVIAKKYTGEEVRHINITHKGSYLIFRVRTKNHFILINALDGTIIRKEAVND